MKTRNYLSIFAIGAAVTMVLGGCTKEIENYENVEKPGTGNDAPVVAVVSAGIESADTKTYMGALEEVDGKKSRKVYWEDGDQIKINGTPSVALSGVGDEAPSVEFGFTGNLTMPYKAVYPAGIWKDAEKADIPKEYASATHASKASFAQNALPMAAYSAEGGNLTFKHLCAVLKLSLTGDKTIDYVEFRGNNGEKVSGIMYIDFEKTELFYGEVVEAQKVVKVQVDQTLSSTPTEIFIAVPVTYQKDAGKATAGVFSKGFTVTVVDTEGALMTKSVTDSRTFEPGKLINMPVLAYAPTEDGSAEHPWKVDTAEEWLAILTDITKDKTGKYTLNHSYVLTADLDFTDKSFGSMRMDGFTGILDGQGHTMSGIKWSGSNSNFGIVGANTGIVKNLNVEAEWTQTGAKGNLGVVGNNSGIVDNVSFKGKVSGGTSGCTAGICGTNAGTVVNCSLLGGIVTASGRYAGGVVGKNTGSVINCFSWAESVNSTERDTGGVVGGLEGGVVINCYSTCENFTSSNNNRAACAVGRLSVSGVRNIYGTNSKVIGQHNKPTSGVFMPGEGEVQYWGVQVTAENMKKEEFVNTLNDGVTDYNGLSFTGKPEGITLKNWEADAETGLPVFAK